MTSSHDPQRVAVLSLHTSPLAQPGKGDSGGMNVYVRELAASLAHRDVEASVYVRKWDDDLPHEVQVEPGVRVVHVAAGRADLLKEELYDVVGDFVEGVIADIEAIGGVDILHANYWLSGVAGHQIKHRLHLPLVTTFHTLARVKAETGDHEPLRRIDAETRVIACSDIVTASCVAEERWLQRLYATDPARIALVTPGVEHALFSPGDKGGARAALGLDDKPVILFVGRLQPLKGPSVAVEALGLLENSDATLVIVGGPSGAEGDAEVNRVHDIIARYDIGHRIRFVDPQPHHLLGTYYRAADVCIVPSRSESFGLVALEAQACGTPVVAAAVGGLRTLVEHGRTGFLIERRDPIVYAAYIDQMLGNSLLMAEMALDAAERAAYYSWSNTAANLMQTYADVRAGMLVDCA